MYTMYLLMWLIKSRRGIKGINQNIYAWHHTQKWDDCVVVFRLVSFSSASKKAETSLSTNCICLFLLSLVAIIFHPPFPDIFFFTRTGYSLDDISDISSSQDLSKALSPATMFTITGITSIVLKFVVMFKELPLKGLPKNRKGQ